MDWPKLAAAVVAGLKAIWPALVNACYMMAGALAQKKISEGNQAEKDLDAMQRADAAVKRVRRLDAAGKLSWLKQRGLLREDKPD